MRINAKAILAVFLATVWISISEFVRNEVLLNSFWTKLYQGLGIKFPSEPINGAMWGFWSLLFAVSIFILAKKFSLWQTTFLAWLVAFVMMWVVIGNLNVLPFGMLWYAVPLSLLESFVATAIIKGLQPKQP